MRRLFLFLFVVATSFITPLLMKQFTYGFKVAKMKLDFPNMSTWDVPFDPAIHEIFQQPFSFLGKGAQCYVFESLDHKYVVKFFRYDKHKRKQKIVNLFDACKLAYDFLKEETGLIYIHLNETQLNLPILFCKDALGRGYTFPLDQMRFVLQKKAIGFKEALEMAKNDPIQMEERFDQFIDLLKSRTDKGVINIDSNLYRNFGFFEKCAVEFDFGNYSYQKDFDKMAEKMRYIERFRCWLMTNAPEWVPLFDQKIEAM